MMIRFVRGPWDGVQFETEYFPSQIGFRDLQVAFGDIHGLEMTMDTRKRLHHQYLLKDRKLKEGVKLIVGENLECEPGEGQDICDLVDENLVVMIYEYAPGEWIWWEQETTGV
jgi:hypothetical protein